MKDENASKGKQIPLKKKLISGDLDVPVAGASFAKAVWTWRV
jgi:hypothetical protein